jgi:uncharacterized protein (DUF427 family)
VSVRMLDHLMARFEELRHEPIGKRVRALAGGETIVDSARAMLVYEPRRVVPTFAVPTEHVAAEIVAAERANGTHEGLPLGEYRVLDPSIPFTVHTAEGRHATVGGREQAGFVADDPDLDGYVLLDFDAFDAWFEEDEQIVSHPRDPFHALDILPSSREVRIELDGEILAVSRRARLLFEGAVLPTRAYLPREDVIASLRPSDRRSWCAYKGEASYFHVGEHEDLAWTYVEPLRHAAEVKGLIAFFNERVDLVLDGEPLPRALTPWS